MSSELQFSVIIPTRNRVASLRRCLESLGALDYPRGSYEVIVVNDGGDCNPAEMIETFKLHLDVTLIAVGQRGPAAARNSGVALSRFEFLAFIDDDCTADPSWLRTVSRHLSEFPMSPVGGRVVNGLESNRYSRASQGLQDFLYSWYHEDRRGSLSFFTTNNLAVSRAGFDSIGEFDSTFPFASEDRDWCDRAIQRGTDLRYAPDAIVYHWHELSLSRFLHQHFRYGRGAVLFHSRRASRRGTSIRLEPLDFYRGMFAAPFSRGRAAPFSEALLLLASQSASLAGFAAEMARTHARNSLG